jgi:hypothetical protein
MGATDNDLEIDRFIPSRSSWKYIPAYCINKKNKSTLGKINQVTDLSIALQVVTYKIGDTSK